jgi:DNA mismatch repair protein MutL
VGRVKVLSEDLVSLISAGEVIENPSSIVKELIENSLDAGADSIDIEVKGGGTEYISVSDNGSGILREDCRVCLHRYSTSKVSSREDISAIGTYGFRGEALASIAAVAELKISTRSAEEEVGTLIHTRVGEKSAISDGGRPPGTRVEVFHLFEKVPARRKHLASPRVENSRMHEVVMKHAVIRSDVGFRFVRDGEIIVDCPPRQVTVDRIASLWGRDVASALLRVHHTNGEIKVSGFLARPPVSRGNRSREYFSVLKRPIADSHLSNAVESAYQSLLMKGQYPVCALDIELRIQDVDVNVHPTKSEVRILDIANVVSTVREAALATLHPQRETTGPTRLDDHYIQEERRIEQATLEAVEAVALSDSVPLEAVQVLEQTMLEEPASGNSPVAVDFLHGVYRVIGQLNELYILLESEEGLLIVDQHAAHERILYEKLRQEIERHTIHVQELLEPIILSLSANEAELILEMAETLNEIGYTVDSFGGGEIAVSALPEVFGTRADEAELYSFLGRAIEVGQEAARETFMDNLIKLTACHSAIRAGQSLSMEQMRELIAQLAKVTRKYNCCHGRPSMVRLKKEDIDKAVGRLGPDAIARYRARHRIN